jgi:pyruvate formate lyase activating enzyme
MGTIFDLKRFSVHDGPGIRTTVFLKGCGLRCWWCHNPESQYPNIELLLRPNICIECGACTCPQGAISWSGDGYVTDRTRCQRCGECVTACYADARQMVGRQATAAEVMRDVLRDRPFYDETGGGVTFSGGEPMLQADFLLELLLACKAEDIHTTVDTCGHAPPAAFDRLQPYVDLFLYDLKVMDNDRHRQVTGAGNVLILDNLRRLAQAGQRIIVRMPIIPHINDDQANISHTAEFLRDLPQIERLDLLPYHRIGGDKYEHLGRCNPMPPTDPPSESQIETIKRQFESYGLQVKIGG